MSIIISEEKFFHVHKCELCIVCLTALTLKSVVVQCVTLALILCIEI